MIINHNINAINIDNNMNKSNVVSSKTMNKIFSGLRINSASDDSAGLAISQKMKAQIRGLEQAQRNVQDAISLIQTAEGGLCQIQNPNLQRMRELAMQAANETLTSEDRTIIQKEIEEIKNGINDIANNTEFNEIKVLRPPISQTPKAAGKADIVFVVDNTASMAGTQVSVANNISNFVSSISAMGVTDVRMGVIDYEESTINKVDFSGSKWTSSTSDVSNALINISTTNAGSTENTMAAITEAASFYDFRPNGIGAQSKYIIFITDESGSDNGNASSTQALLQSSGIQLEGVYCSTSSSFSTFNNLVSNTGGIPVNLEDSNWGSNLSSILGSHIGTSAGTTVEDDKMPVLNFQVGSNAGEVFPAELFDARTLNLGIEGVIVDPFEEAEKAISKIDKAIEVVSTQRAKFGSYQNALEHIYNNISNGSTNLNSAVSRIEDADVAKEVMEMSKSNILQQSAQSLMIQANKMPESILNLMKQWGQA